MGLAAVIGAILLNVCSFLQMALDTPYMERRKRRVLSSAFWILSLVTIAIFLVVIVLLIRGEAVICP